VINPLTRQSARRREPGPGLLGPALCHCHALIAREQRVGFRYLKAGSGRRRTGVPWVSEFRAVEWSRTSDGFGSALAPAVVPTADLGSSAWRLLVRQSLPVPGTVASIMADVILSW
jgi:hypothetical protein